MTNSHGASIELHGVKLRRGSRLVFDGLSLSLTERRVGLLGNNGAGKSSFLRLLNGLLLPDEGKVRVHGLDTTTSRRELPGKVGFVFQNPEHQIVFPTVLEEIAFGFREHGSDRANANARARDVLAKFGCSDWVDAAVHELSDGQKQRLCILAIIATEPEILVMDEPFASLDLPTRLDLTDFLMRLPQRIIIASHELDLLGMLDRVIWLSDGAIFGDGLPDRIIAAYRDHVMTSRNRMAASA
jgi:biotin transport system ATP-binding protein